VIPTRPVTRIILGVERIITSTHGLSILGPDSILRGIEWIVAAAAQLFTNGTTHDG
jgi:hypothetical protein